MSKRGRKFTEIISALVTPEDKERIDKFAVLKDITVSKLIRYALDEYIKNHGGQ